MGMANTKQRVIMSFKNDSFTEQLFALLLERGKVKVGGLGVFEIKRVASRKGWNVGGGGGEIIIPAHNRIAFRPTKKFREGIQKYGK
jgi:nucleoid DNA-binding protein